jgi:Rho GTPase-activating protein 1
LHKIVTLNGLSELDAHVPTSSLRIPISVVAHNYSIENIYCPVSELGSSPRRLVYDVHEGIHRLPRWIRCCVYQILMGGGLSIEGIFRRAPLQGDLDMARRAFDLRHLHLDRWARDPVQLLPYEPGTEVGDSDSWFPSWSLRDENEIPLTAAALLMRLIRGFPEPVFSETLYSQIETELQWRPNTRPSKELDERIVQVWQSRLQDLLFPPHHSEVLSDGTALRWILSVVCGTLYEIQKHSNVNKMTSANLAIVVAPNMVRGRDPVRDINAARPGGAIGELVRVWIDRWEDCWGQIYRREVQSLCQYKLPRLRE